MEVCLDDQKIGVVRVQLQSLTNVDVASLHFSIDKHVLGVFVQSSHSWLHELQKQLYHGLLWVYLVGLPHQLVAF